jgi:LIM domain kinase 1
MNDLAVTQVDFEALEFQKVVASGSYGKVWKGSYKGTTVAVKEIIMSEPETIGPIFREFRRFVSSTVAPKNDAYLKDKHFREVWTMGMACVHPNIVSYSGFAIRKTGSGLLSASSESPGLAILMEFIPFGNLYSYLHKEVTINWKMRLRIATDLTKGLTFLHSTNIVVRLTLNA